MAITARYIVDDIYIIGNHKYGNELCRVDLRHSLTELLTSDEESKLIELITKAINMILEQKENSQPESWPNDWSMNDAC